MGRRARATVVRCTRSCREFVHLPIPIPGFPDTVTVRGIGYAAPVVGTTVAESVCSGTVWVPAPPH